MPPSGNSGDLPDLVAEIQLAAEAIFDDSEFRHYRKYKGQILAQFTARIDQISARVSDIWYAPVGVKGRLDLNSANLRSVLIDALLYIPLMSLAVDTAVEYIAIGSKFVISAVLLLSIFLITRLAIRARNTISEGLHLRMLLIQTKTGYDNGIETVVKEEISRAINDVLGTKGIVAFPTHAPRLVELGSSKITPSATVRQVQDFILGHETSAIGLAGVRGSGKSTVLRVLSESTEFFPFVTVVASPVRYDPGEFIRRLLYEVAVTITKRVPDLDRATRRLRLRSKIEPPDVRQAREILHSLRYEVERGSGSKRTIKLRSVYEESAESTLKVKSRAMAYADLVVALRDLLELFGKSSRNILVVCIDELDKLEQPEHLVSVVNELKDLFHIPRIHFVVTVSTDALRSFERRGLADRDAFDSAFDTVVSTRWLTLDESLAVISSRAAGFAPLIAMFCHAWSGGLVRDLLRAARKTVELQKARQDEPLTIGEMVSDLVFDDLHSAVHASLLGLDPEDGDIDALWELRRVLADARTTNAETCQSHLAALSFSTPVLEVLRAKSQLGVHLVGLAVTAEKSDSSGDTGRLRPLLAEFGAAMVAITGPRPMRDSAVAETIARKYPGSGGAGEGGTDDVGVGGGDGVVVKGYVDGVQEGLAGAGAGEVGGVGG